MRIGVVIGHNVSLQGFTESLSTKVAQKDGWSNDNIECLRMGGGYWPLGLPAALCATPDTSAAGWVWWPPGCLGLHTTGHKDVFCVKYI